MKGVDGKKMLICQYYNQFCDDYQNAFQEFRKQVEKASSEAFVLGIGDFNIDLEKLGDNTYYRKPLAEDYQALLGYCGLECIDFGITWRRFFENGEIKESAIDHAFSSKGSHITSFTNLEVGFSDHSAIILDLKTGVLKNS